MSIGVLTFYIHLPGCKSLKEKRGLLKPFLARLHREFNLSVAEIDHNDIHREAVIACALVSNDPVFIRRVLQKVSEYTANNWPNLEIIEQKIELL